MLLPNPECQNDRRTRRSRITANGRSATDSILCCLSSQLQSVLDWRSIPILLAAFFGSVIPLTIARSTLLAEHVTEMDVQPDAPVTASWLRLTRQMVSDGRLEDARKECERRIAEQPNLPSPEVILARLLAEIGDESGAKRMLESWSLEAPDAFELRIAVARIAIAQNRWFDAWTHLQAANISNAPSRWTDEKRAEQRRERRRLAALTLEGRRDHRKALEIYRSLDGERTDEADDNESQVARANSAVLEGLARCSIALEKTDDAFSALRRLAETRSSLESAELSIARILVRQGKTDEAERWFQRAIEHGGTDGGDAALAYAQVLIRSTRAEAAVKILDSESLTLSSKQQELGDYLRGVAARWQGDLVKAQAHFAALHQDAPAKFEYGNQLSLVLVESDVEAERVRAMQLARNGVRNHPQLAEAWATLGWIQLRMGDLKSAAASLEKAMSGGTLNSETAAYVSHLMHMRGDRSKAAQYSSIAGRLPGPHFTKLP